MCMEVGRAVMGADTEMERGTLEEQVQEVEPSGGEWRGALLCLCQVVPSVCLLSVENGGVVTGDLKDEMPLYVIDGQQHLNGSSVIHFLRFLMSLRSQ